VTPVKIYTTTYCPYCDRAKALLRRKGAAYEEIDVTGDDEARERLVKMAGGLKTVPQIWVGDRHVGGFDRLSELDRSGELDRLLNGEASSPPAR
jgi:glutaredoxin 3